MFPTLGFTATRSQAATYLFAVALFSISFLVFLNSTVSYVITRRIGQLQGVGDKVGTLGFADELVALVACPVWGMVSDRIGVRAVAVVGYGIVGLSLFLFVQAENVYPQLLLGRMFFSIGGAATATMVTAILPSMTYREPNLLDSRTPSRQRNGGFGHQVTPSISSELTITPARFRSQSPPQERPSDDASAGAATSQLAGIVGMCTGFGALLALGGFLPLPVRFEKNGKSASEAIADSYYVVGSIAICVGLVCLFGLRNLPGEDAKSWRWLLSKPEVKQEEEGTPYADSPKEDIPSYLRLLLNALKLGFQDSNIGLGYLGGFVARAASVAISAFIPLYTNAYFIRSGRCSGNPDSDDIKSACREAYTLAAILTGVSQMAALCFAPVFGYLSGRFPKYHLPLLCASVAGIVGYIAFALLHSPDPKSPSGSHSIFFIVILLGLNQIGAIVCSLGTLGRGIQGQTPTTALTADHGTSQHEEHVPSSFHRSSSTPPTPHPNSHDPSDFDYHASESTPLIPSLRNPNPNTTATAPFQAPYAPAAISSTPITTSFPTPMRGGGDPSLPTPTTPSNRVKFKGAIAGAYSLAGGAAILLLTKIGGLLFDNVSPGAPFWIMAGFNGILFCVVVVLALREEGVLVGGNATTPAATTLNSDGVPGWRQRQRQDGERGRDGRRVGAGTFFDTEGGGGGGGGDD